MYSKESKSKDNFNFDLSVGYISYRDKEYFFDGSNVKGGNIGMRTSVSYLLRITNGVYSGPKLGLQFGSIKDFTLEKNGSTSQTINLNNTSESVSNFDFGLVSAGAVAQEAVISLIYFVQKSAAKEFIMTEFEVVADFVFVDVFDDSFDAKERQRSLA